MVPGDNDAGERETKRSKTNLAVVRGLTMIGMIL
jgi:hypothetical protein